MVAIKNLFANQEIGLKACAWALVMAWVIHSVNRSSDLKVLTLSAVRALSGRQFQSETILSEQKVQSSSLT